MHLPEREARQDLFGDRIAAARVRADTGRHFAVTTASGVGTRLLRLATLVVLARVLAPADYGAVALVMSVYGVAQLLMDLGLSAATVQRERITPAQVNTLFWINAGLGGVLTLAGVAAAPLLALLFTDPRLEPAGRVLALGFVVGALAAQPLALLRRSLRFGTIARISVVSTVVNCATALTLALLGWHFWALVVASLAGDLATALGAWWRSGWRPAAPRYDPSSRELLAFGGYLAAFAFMTYLGRNLHVIFIGRFWGAAAAGLYTRAFGLLEQPLNLLMGPLRLIAPAALSRLTQSPADFRGHYLDTMALVLLVVAPLSAWLAFAAPDVVAVVLGPRWLETGELLQWLALGLVPQVLNQSTGWLYMATGRSRAMMQWGIGGWVVVILCLLLGLRWGVRGVAAMHAVSMILILVPCLHYACRDTAVTLGDIARVAWPPCAVALVAALVFVPVSALRARPLVDIAVSAPAYALAFVAVAALLPGQRRRLLGVVTHVRGLLRPAAQPAAPTPRGDGH